MSLPKIIYTHILYATDFSENWQEVFWHAQGLAQYYQAKLSILNVLDPDLFDLLVFDPGTERSISIGKRIADTKEFTNQAKQNTLLTLQPYFEKNMIDPQNVRFESGNPVKMILKVSSSEACDLIVMGAKGRSTLEDVTLGDTVSRVLHRSKVPVLVVPKSMIKG